MLVLAVSTVYEQFFAFGKHIWLTYFPANIHFFKVTNRSTRKKSEVCSKLTIKTSEKRH